jgi:DNA-binding SARP family transcriptional activator
MSVPGPEVELGVLGEVRAVVDGVEVEELGGPQARVVLAALVVAGGRVVSAEALVDAVWPGEPPASASGTLHSYVSRLRRALGPAGPLLERRGAGYRLAAPERAFDWWRFEDLAERGRAALLAGDAAGARELLLQAQSLWRGEALSGLGERPFAVGLVARLQERRESATGDRLEAELRLGRHAALLGELAEAVQERPLDEARWARLALARYRSGQQAEALKALADARRTLVDELGVEPSPALRELELQVLRQDPALDLPRAASGHVRTPALPAQRGPSTARPDSGLVGRAQELEVLLTVLDEARRSARLGVVEGEPGIGKTRLLEEVAAVAADGGALVLWGRSHESGAAPAFWPWLPVLRALRDRDPGSAEPGLLALLDARGDDVTPVGVFAVMDAVASALRRTSGQQPVVVLLDDLQWADPASLQLLAFLATHLEDEPVLVLGTVREGADRSAEELTAALAAVARRRGSRRLRLAGLDEDGTAALVRQTRATGADEAEVRRIHARAEGNPFFTAQLAELLEEGHAHETPVPAGVSDVVRQRLTRLPRGTSDVLQLCAVMGREIDLAVLPTATRRSVEQCLSDLEPAVEHRMLLEVDDRPGTLHFAHALVREVLVEDLSSVRRLRLHLQVADALESSATGDDHAELLAEHLWAAAPMGVGERAAAAAERAAEVAIRRFALQSAVELLERAAALRRAAGSSHAHEVAELDAVLRLASVRRALEGFAGVADVLERGEALARRTGNTVAERELLWARWAMADTACDFAIGDPIANHLYEQAQQTDDPVVRRLGLHVRAIQCWHRGRLPESRDAFDAGHQVPASEDSGNTLLSFERERLLLDTAFRLHVHELLEDLPDVREQLDRVATGLDPFGTAMVATFSCSGAAAAGDHVRVASRARPVVEADRDQLLSFWGAQARMQYGWAVVCQGDVEEGMGLFRDGYAVYSSAGLHTGTGLFLGNIALALLEQGEVEQAAEWAARGRAEQDEYGEAWTSPIVVLAEAELARARGEDAAGLYAAAADQARAMSAAGMLRRVEQAAGRAR